MSAWTKALQSSRGMNDNQMSGNIIRGMPESEYHALRALSASGAWTMIQECPAQFWHDSPWNPNFVPKNKRDFDVGTAAHLAVLEPDRMADRVVLIDAENYKKAAAQAARDAAWNAGLVPLLPKDHELVDGIASALRADQWASDLLDGCESEISFTWIADGVPCKARVDLISRDGAVFGDLKTSTSANPRTFQRNAFNMGHFLRDPWYRDGWERATGQRILYYWFVVISREPPHLVTVCRLDERAIEWGRMMIRKARRLFCECQDAGCWPGYCREPMTLSLPAWSEFQLADREQAGEFSVKDSLRSRGFLAP